jgi:hypothetical protein
MMTLVAGAFIAWLTNVVFFRVVLIEMAPVKSNGAWRGGRIATTRSVV